uniref:Uncharacterized protein n=1 Tax=Strongyloides papillosus TaxID=174720 RepID=A0A0N5BZV6_STREA
MSNNNKELLCAKFNPNHIRRLFDDSSECSSPYSVKTQSSVRTQNSFETQSSFVDKESQERENVVEKVVDKVCRRRGRPRKKKFDEMENNPESYQSRIEENEKKKSCNSSFANLLSSLENKENGSKSDETGKNSGNEESNEKNSTINSVKE